MSTFTMRPDIAASSARTMFSRAMRGTEPRADGTNHTDDFIVTLLGMTTDETRIGMLRGLLYLLQEADPEFGCDW